MSRNQKRHIKARRSGFTLAEAMLATVVLGIAAAGILLPFSSGATIQAEGMHMTLGIKLASDLVQEIVSTPFAQIVAKYNYSEAEGQVEDANGVVFTDQNYARFSRNVSCQYVTVPQQPTQSEPEECNFILITVRVAYSGNDIAIINRLISE
ncbi:MAG: prepilin-type N-terminal cleavage/methylation domain-containing protein [Sedimentisphaerales bacterium]|nr:prepilin-type N-terminal cleavage/methylation domain-containing protein [Sedimentisphaerales bacterium]